MLRRLFQDPSNLMNLNDGSLRGLVFRPPRELDAPTYRILGNIERYDSRDQVYSRQLLWPGSKEYEDYYSRYPQKKSDDDRRRQRAIEVGKTLQERDPLNQYLSLSGFYGAVALSRPDIVEAQKIRMRISPVDMVDVKKIHVDPEEMSSKIKAFGLYLGAAKVHIAQLNQKWVYSRHGPPQYGKSVELNYKYIICLAITQDPFMIAGGASQAVDLEVGFKYGYASFISTIIANFIRRLGWPARQLPTFSAPYLIPPVFVDAGIGEDGRCGYVVTKEFGNNFRPAAVATDLPLIADKPVDFGLQDFCDKCKICAEKCPAGAIPKGGREVVRGVRKWQINADKCFDYWIAKGSTCGVCQTVCPWNHPNNWFHSSIRELGSRFASLRNLLITGERIFYGNKKSKPKPNWMASYS